MKFLKPLHIVLSILSIVFLKDLRAQEELKPLSANINIPVLKPKPNNLASKTSSITPKDLPFYDDFSYGYKSQTPSTNHWIDSNVYINTTFAIAPISIGVATFDGLNKKGYPYNLSATVSNSGKADTLTSVPINLKQKGALVYSATSDVYFSFYYQAEGRGDSPEPNDSLCLEFLKHKNDTATWVKVWGKSGYNPSATDTNFRSVIIKITDPFYFDSLFQFRFRNKATQSGSLDHWHIDNVYMESGRNANDTLKQDINMAYKPSSFLLNYCTMPYRQFQHSELGPTFTNYFRSNYPSGSSPVSGTTYKYNVYEQANLTPTLSVDLGPLVDGIDAFVDSGYYKRKAWAFPSAQTFSAAIPNSLSAPNYYRIEHITYSGTSDFDKVNDTIFHKQEFTDYFAYDDGSAEVGYYLNTYGAKTAVKYHLNVADTVKALKIYFDPIIDGQLIVNSKFRMMIWNDGGGQPGSVRYKDSLIAPTYLQGCYNLVPTYSLTSCVVLPAGTYYFGIQQLTNQPLNIGFDKNTNHSDALYYDIGNGWVQSAIKGSLMINPVMGCAYLDPVGVTEHTKNESLLIYPNPAQNALTIKTPGGDIENTLVEIRSSLGQLVYSATFANNETIDISHLPNGIYFVSINNKEQNVIPKKLIISR